MSAILPPMAPGQYTTSDDLDADLGKVYQVGNNLYKFVNSTAALSGAGGKVLVHTVTAGVLSTGVVTTTTANTTPFAGVVPITGDIASSTALAAGTRLLVQIAGPASIQASSLVTNGLPLGTFTTAGAAGGIASTVTVETALPACFGYAINSTVATVAGGVITCVLTRSY